MIQRSHTDQEDSIHALLVDASTLRNQLNASTVFESNAINAQNILERAEKFLRNSTDLRPSHRLVQLNGESLAKICTALGHIKIKWSDCTDFFKIALIDNIHHHHGTMSAKDAANVLWALARMGCPSKGSSTEYFLNDQTLHCLKQACLKTMEDFIPQTYSNILWAFAVLGCDFITIQDISLIFIMKLLAALLKNPLLNEFDIRGVKQLADFIVHYSHDFPPAWHPALHPLATTLDAQIATHPIPRSSKLHLEIANAVRKNCVNEFVCEYPIAGGYADICFTNERVVFEVNGPTHYNKDGQLTARSLFRQHIMEKCGYRVFHIHHLAWENAENKDQLLRNLALAAGLQVTITMEPPLSASLPLMIFTVPSVTVNINISPTLFYPAKPEKGIKRKLDQTETEPGTLGSIRCEEERDLKRLRFTITND